eukprot:scaffold26940_cov117-Phaeocystis_antarctica.AAC.1
MRTLVSPVVGPVVGLKLEINGVGRYMNLTSFVANCCAFCVSVNTAACSWIHAPVNSCTLSIACLPAKEPCVTLSPNSQSMFGCHARSEVFATAASPPTSTLSLALITITSTSTGGCRPW